MRVNNTVIEDIIVIGLELLFKSVEKLITSAGFFSLGVSALDLDESSLELLLTDPDHEGDLVFKSIL